MILSAKLARRLGLSRLAPQRQADPELTMTLSEHGVKPEELASACLLWFLVMSLAAGALSADAALALSRSLGAGAALIPPAVGLAALLTARILSISPVRLGARGLNRLEAFRRVRETCAHPTVAKALAGAESAWLASRGDELWSTVARHVGAESLSAFLVSFDDAGQGGRDRSAVRHGRRGGRRGREVQGGRRDGGGGSEAVAKH